MAALHCAIQPGDTVLELGYGPGLGLHFAAKMLTDPRGHLIGVDYSEYMHQVKSFFFFKKNHFVITLLKAAFQNFFFFICRWQVRDLRASLTVGN